MNKQRIGLFGATSLVGECLLRRLTENNWAVTAFSRVREPSGITWNTSNVVWQLLKANEKNKANAVHEKITLWITVAPIWTLPEHFDLLLAYGIKRIIALSSTSRFTKKNSSDFDEQDTARRLIEGESRLRIWAENNGVNWVILRPTLIYGLGRDKNISEIARFIGRFGFFPLLGPANGLRQPIHVKDVAITCLAALTALDIINCSYNLTGGETIGYREMVTRVLIALGNEGVIACKYLRPRLRLLIIPRWSFQLAAIGLRQLPHYQHWTMAAADRMNEDLVFDCSKAIQYLNFSPRPFNPGSSDLPKNF